MFQRKRVCLDSSRFNRMCQRLVTNDISKCKVTFLLCLASVAMALCVCACCHDNTGHKACTNHVHWQCLKTSSCLRCSCMTPMKTTDKRNLDESDEKKNRGATQTRSRYVQVSSKPVTH